MLFSLRDGEKDVGTATGVDACGSADDLEAGRRGVDAVGVDFGCVGVHQQRRIGARDHASGCVPNIPIARAVGAFDKDETSAASEAAVDGLRCACACVAAYFGDSGACGEEVINKSIADTIG